MGYPHGKKGRKLFDLETQTYFVSHDVVFYESQFSYLASTGSTTISTQPSISANDCTYECSETENLNVSLVSTELEPSAEVVEELTKQLVVELLAELHQPSSSVVEDYVEQSSAPSGSDSVAHGDVG
ncbi:hypothetical protein LIER_33244 [Lithospermum erythrorhizon]|uniref:Retroviral polymerase SH3-like domain-containing protein n=1 Tax=Lithospermum erythrorhizon TaxID=34254 RepID=A0AAV3S1E4_LITER